MVNLRRSASLKNIKIAIVGRKADTRNYENYISTLPADSLTTLITGEIASCCALVLPGGGDITPAFFGEQNTASRNIDTELDILQFQALEYAIRHSLPVLGICKGMQVINVALGGTITQHLPTAQLHIYQNGDQYHATRILENSCLYSLYGKEAVVNSAHHQGVGKVGEGLTPIQWSEQDNCIEALVHEKLPILGLQWHPERLNRTKTSVSAAALLTLFASWIGY